MKDRMNMSRYSVRKMSEINKISLEVSRSFVWSTFNCSILMEFSHSKIAETEFLATALAKILFLILL